MASTDWPAVQRITVEFSSKDIAKVLGEPPRINTKIRSLEILRLSRSTSHEVAGIIRIEFKDPATRFRDVFTDPSERATILRKEGTSSYICFYRRRQPRPLLHLSTFAKGAYLSRPYEIKDGRVRATLTGHASAIRKFIDSLNKTKLHSTIVFLPDTRFSFNSPLDDLTEKQKKVILLAYRLGYYDLPRKIDSRDLAKKVGIREATFTIHRRKAEKKLLGEMLDGTWRA